MKVIILVIPLVLVIGFFSFTQFAFAASNSTSTNSTSVTVTIAHGASSSQNACVSTNNCFTPNPVQVAPGDAVTWTNTDSASHTVTSGKPDNSTGNIIGAVFDSGLLAPGKAFSHIFTTADVETIHYFCQVHPWMIGQVEVNNPSINTPTITNPTNGVTVFTSTIIVSGTSIPYAIIQITDNDNGIVGVGFTIADGSGSWSDIISLGSGTNQLNAEAMDIFGISSSSSTVTVNLNIVPSPPVINSPTNGAVLTQTPMISGTSMPNLSITVYDGTTLVGSTTASNTGSWSLTTSILSTGSHTLTAKATNIIGTSQASSPINIITGVPPPPVIVSPVNGATVNTLTPTIIGTSIPNANIQVFAGTTLVGSTTASAIGTWSLTTSILSAGSDSITAKATNSIGASNPSNAVTVATSTVSITVTTDKTSYNDGGKLTISGTLSDFISGTPVSVIIKNPVGNVVLIIQVDPSTDKTYSTTVTAGGNSLWQAAGTYEVDVQFGSKDVSTKTTFQFTGFTMASYITDLLSVYNTRPDLQAAFPEAAHGSLNNLLAWAGTSGITIDSAHITLVPHAAVYKLMYVYSIRPDLQAAFPEAANAANLTNLFAWANVFGFAEECAILCPNTGQYSILPQ